jgi:mRNA-degrading endonuclease RelE of RelBE toxin-antitoxin system
LPYVSTFATFRCRLTRRACLVKRDFGARANPHVDVCKKLKGREGYRLRIGDWRVLYEINDGKLVIVVLAIKPRGGAYE